MNRLWLAVLVVGCASGVALGAGVSSGAMWPGVGMFAVFALLACVAGACDAAASDRERERQEDAKDAAAQDEGRLATLEAKVEHLQKKDALSALG